MAFGGETTVPSLRATVPLRGAGYRLGEPGEERVVHVPSVRIGRWPVCNADAARFVAATGHPVAPDLARRLAAPALADHPVTDLTYADAEALCAWASAELGAAVRLPTGDEWEVAARGGDGRPWPWGDVFEPERCACAEAGAGWTAAVTAHPGGAGPSGAEQLAGNVWEWVSDRTPDGWRLLRGGCWLDHAWGVRAARSLPADPRRATPTTGMRIVVEERSRT